MFQKRSSVLKKVGVGSTSTAERRQAPTFAPIQCLASRPRRTKTTAAVVPGDFFNRLDRLRDNQFNMINEVNGSTGLGWAWSGKLHSAVSISLHQ